MLRKIRQIIVTMMVIGLLTFSWVNGEGAPRFDDCVVSEYAYTLLEIE